MRVEWVGAGACAGRKQDGAKKSAEKISGSLELRRSCAFFAVFTFDFLLRLAGENWGK